MNQSAARPPVRPYLRLHPSEPAFSHGGLSAARHAPPPPPAATPGGKPKLLDQVRDAIRTRHYSYRTEEAYAGWIKRFIFFHGKRHPAEMGKQEIEQFLTALAVKQHVAASTQNQALGGHTLPLQGRPRT